ncbi:SIMPL domain-containing protein [Puniceibacterium confluentis]|uniref:SIMPL domain-containing protein n=1 Tax=Puniceibacterium confluentis TaxID=1958944 RepID=UPI00356B5C58
MRRNAFVTALVPLALMLATPLAAQDLPRPTISVSGEGTAYAVPDVATITLGVTSQAEQAADAMAQTSETVGTILARLVEMGLVARDVQTSDLSLNPIWSNRSVDNQPPRIEGFEASNQVTIRVQDLEKLGDVLGAVLGDGANRLGGLSFGLKNPEPLLDIARRDAVADAMARAKVYAEAAGVTLGPVLSISEGGTSIPRPEMMMEMRVSDASVPVAAGETGLTAAVSMVFAIGE